MSSRSTLLAGVSIVALSLGACDSQPSSSGPASPPPHPAMVEAASKGSQSPGASSARPGLPPDHPPIAEMPVQAPGGAPVRPTGAAPAGGGLAAKLAQAGLAVTLPQGWIEEAPTSNMRLATIRLPRVEGDAEDGEVSVSFAGGNLEANLDRWVAQFTEKPAPVKSDRQVGGLHVTMMELEGTFTGGGGPMMKSAAPKPGTKLVGAIIEPPGSGQFLFFKGWGPKATMEKWRPSFDELVSSIRPAK